MPISWKQVKFFKPEEFDDPMYPGSGGYIDGVLLFELEKLRKATGWPIITHAKVGGCVDMDAKHGHSRNSYHIYANGCKACDFHFLTDEDPRLQYRQVEDIGFPGIGVYYDWHWNGKLLPIGFHVDMRPKDQTQRWARRNKEYFYLLGRNN